MVNLEEAIDDQLMQFWFKCGEFDKYLLVYVMVKLGLLSGKILIFVNDIDRCYRLKLFLEQFSIKSCVLNAELPLKSRFHIIEEYNRGIYDIIIATDEATVDSSKTEAGSGKKKQKVEKDGEFGAARGVDFVDVGCVVNFDFPLTVEHYLHRVGRTARAGRMGMSLSFVMSKDERAEDVRIKKKKRQLGQDDDEVLLEQVIKHQKGNFWLEILKRE